ncbi:MAG: YcnI family protein [Mycetocola sp.]
MSPLRSPSSPFRSRTIAAGVLAGTALAVAVPLAAIAHVSVTPSTTAAGSTTQLTFSVGHGCDGSATTALAFTIPEEIVAVTPTVNPNWTVEKVMVDLAEPITDAHGTSLVERVGQVVYTARAPLADGYRDTVTLQLTLPEDADGSTLAFPVLQSCEVGETDWSELADTGQDAHELDAPAPTITVTAAEAEEAHGATAAVAPATDASSTTAAPSEPDLIARGLGLAGLVVGVSGILFAVITRRRTAPVTPNEGSHS